jgi:hypothetical protein
MFRFLQLFLSFFYAFMLLGKKNLNSAIHATLNSSGGSSTEGPEPDENEKQDCANPRDVANEAAQRTLDNPVLTVGGIVQLTPEQKGNLKNIAKQAMEELLDPKKWPCIKVTKNTKKRGPRYLK